MRPIIKFFARGCFFAGRRLDRLTWCQAYQDHIPSRDVLLREIYQKMDSGMPWDQAVRDPRACAHGERVAEYPHIYAKLQASRPRRLLDVGCVMNNPIIDPLIPEACEVSFLNPASEPIVRTRATYHRRPMEEFAPAQPFDLVTCLSTIEHIGFDNTRYGTTLTDEGWDWERTIREFLGILRRLRRFAPPHGEVVVSLPYGRKEFVHYPPVKGPRVWQVAHSEHIRALTQDEELRDARLITMKLEREGWRLSRPEEAYEPFGTVGTGASGLLILEMKGTAGSPAE